jgi:hypothetical protein
MNDKITLSFMALNPIVVVLIGTPNCTHVDNPPAYCGDSQQQLQQNAAAIESNRNKKGLSQQWQLAERVGYRLLFTCELKKHHNVCG